LELKLPPMSATASVRSRVEVLLLMVAVAAVYAAFGRIGLHLATVQQNATLIWPPSGIALAVLLLFGVRLWPGVLAGAFLVNLSIGSPLLIAVMVAVGNTLGAVVGARVLVGVLGLDVRLARVRDVGALLLAGVIASTLISPTVGVLALHLTSGLGGAVPQLVWRDWWLGDAGGVLVVTPVLLIGLRGQPTWMALLRRVEAWAIWASVVLTAGLTWWAALTPGWAVAGVLAPMPLLVWAGVRLGPRGAMVASSLATGIAIGGTLAGAGPFIGTALDVQVTFLWAWCIAVAGIGLILAASTAEREESERQRLREEQAHHALQTKMLEAQRLEGLGVLAGGLAHDFNNILASIRGNAELLGEAIPPSTTTDPLVAEIDTAVDRAAELCRQMLAYAGKGQGVPTPIALDGLVGELRPLITASIPKRVETRVEADADLPGVLSEPVLLRQLLLNLVINGAEAIGERPGTVDIRLSTDGAWVVLEVEDDGDGMDEATRLRMFDPFFTTKFLGRGLGLASANGVVRSCGGSIEVESQLGEGTLVRVRLPATTRPKRRPVADRTATRHRTTPGIVLVVEDEPEVRQVVERMLEKDGYQVSTAGDGEEGVERALALGDDLVAIVMDLTMPKMGGLEALELLRQYGVAVPIIVTSGYADSALPARLDATFLEKPFTLAELRNAIRALIPPPAKLRLTGGTST
jgi:signal transduction histidine kinase/CheY-like chemotaxis protein